MLAFPQLLTGAGGMYPIAVRHSERTVVNELAGGGVRRYSDARAVSKSWRLEFQDLAGEEAQRIQTLHTEVEGRLGTFVFLDPTQNLLRWSDNPSADVWVSDPPITISVDSVGPLPNMAAATLVNGSSIEQGIFQTISAPAHFTYCFSCYCRSQQSSAVRLSWSDGSSTESRTVVPDTIWRRVFVAGAIVSSSDSVTFRLDVGAGGTVDVAGLLVENQPDPGPYRRSTARSGVIEKARFVEDKLTIRAIGWNRYAGVIELTSAE